MTSGVQFPGNIPWRREASTPKDAPPAGAARADEDLDAVEVDDDAKAGKAGKKVVLRESDLLKLMNGDLDPQDLLPASGPVADAYAGLAGSGFTVSDAQVKHSIASFDKHREALVVTDEKSNAVYSFAGTAEIETFKTAVSSPASLPSEQKALLDDLKSIEAGGGQIAFTRSGKLLPTDAAGGLVLVSRGEDLVVLDKYGEHATVASAADAAAQAQNKPAADPAKDEVADAIQALEKKEFSVEPDFGLPEDVQVTDMKKMFKHQLSEMVSRDPDKLPINHKKAAIVRLVGDGTATVVPPSKPAPALALPGLDEDEPEPEPMELPAQRVVNRAQLKELAEIQSGKLTPAQTKFFDDMQKIRGDATRTPMVFSRESTGIDTGALHKANDLVAWLNLVNGGEMVLLNSDGSITHLDNAKEVHEYASTGTVTRTRPAPVDPKIDKTNLLMLYYNSPFDPTQKGGIYEDTPMRASQVGSNAHVDMVTLRSDLPQKKNLRTEYLQPDDMQLLEAGDPKTLMNDPKTLEKFVYDTLKAHPNDKHVRLMVAGHGGAELGLLPDGEANDASAHGAMSVDDFASAVHDGLARFNKESGQSKKIDNLIVGSCLMANTSFIHALAKKGDIKVLSASPETLMGNDPNIIFSYLADPKTADKSAEEFAADMVDLLEGASAFPGGKKNLQFADTFGAYDLDTSKGKAMEDSLDKLFKAVVAEPDYARYVKEDIAACPTYGVNRIMNFQFGINQRDVIQVAERIAGDARIKSDAIKAACKEVVDATSAVVMKQKMGERYADRRGPTLYLPTETFMVDERLMKTDLLQSTSFTDFVNLVSAQPANRSLMESLTYEVDRVMSGMRKSARDKKKPAQGGSSQPGGANGSGASAPAGTATGSGAASGASAASASPGAVSGDDDAVSPASGTSASSASPKSGAQQGASASGKASASAKSSKAGKKKLTLVLGAPDSEADQAAESLRGLAKTYRPWYKQIWRYAVGMPVVAAATAVGAAAGAAVGLTLMTPLGTLLGLRAGLTGRSIAQNFLADKPDAATPPAGTPATPPAGTPASGAPSTPQGGGSANASPNANSGSNPQTAPQLPPELDGGLGKMTRPIVRVGVQAAFFPMEAGGEMVNRSVAYAHGNALGRLSGSVVGTASGAIGGALSGALLGGAAGGFIAHAIASRIMGTRQR